MFLFSTKLAGYNRRMSEFDMASIMQRIATQFPALLLALVFHEFAHAWMAHRYGDKTALWSGRMTLNPSAHVDVLGTLILPLTMMFFGGGFFGWAKPVPINPNEFRHFRRGIFWVSFAGPLSNVILGAGTALLYPLVVAYFPAEAGSIAGFAHAFLRAFILINFILALFNLLPLPPLDGSKMVQSFLDFRTIDKYESVLNPMNSMFLIFFLAMSGILTYVIFLPAQFFSNTFYTVGVMIWQGLL